MGKAKNKKKKSKRKNKAPPEPTVPEGSTASAAAQYLQQWALQQQQPAGEAPVWKFNKSKQVFLLRAWPQREKLSSDTFKLMLAYAKSLPTACAERTIVQARELAAKAEAEEQALLAQAEAAEKPEGAGGAVEADDDDGDDAAQDAADAKLNAEAREERRAILKIQRARALRLLQVLVAPDVGT